MSFVEDLESGKKSEDTVIRFLENSPELMQGLMKVKKAKGNFSDYDFKISASFEVKNDLASEKSENYCFETHNPKSGQFTGIMLSKANYIIYISNNGIIIFDRLKLINELTVIEKLKKAKGKYRLLKSMGNGNSAGILVNKEYVLKNFKSIIFSKFFN